MSNNTINIYQTRLLKGPVFHNFFFINENTPHFFSWKHETRKVAFVHVKSISKIFQKCALVATKLFNKWEFEEHMIDISKNCLFVLHLNLQNILYNSHRTFSFFFYLVCQNCQFLFPVQKHSTNCKQERAILANQLETKAKRTVWIV